VYFKLWYSNYNKIIKWRSLIVDVFYPDANKSETTTYSIFLSDGYANCKWVKLDKWEQNFEWLGSFAEGSLLDLTFEMQKLKDHRKDLNLLEAGFSLLP